MSQRRRGPTAESKARADRIAAALEGLLEEHPVDEQPVPTGSSSHPYRPHPVRSRPRPAKGLRCPGCGATMFLSYDRGLQLERCPQCGGLWLDPGELDQVGEPPVSSTVDVPRLRREMSAITQLEEQVRYRKCPRCDDVMNRINFGAASGVIIDECPKHGVYLDPDELEAIERFVELGGLELGRRSSEERLRRRAVRAEAELAEARTQSMWTARASHRVWWSVFSWFDW